MTKAKTSESSDLEAFKALLPTLSVEEGRFALIAQGKLVDTFDTYGDAMKAGYEARGLKSFLVKQISTVEVVANFTRHIAPQWHISA